MTYDRHVIAQMIRRQLRQSPGLSKAAAALALGMDRHTVDRALGSLATTFEELRSENRRQIVEAADRRNRVLTKKELMAALGFHSSKSLSRWLRQGSAGASSSGDSAGK